MEVRAYLAGCVEEERVIDKQYWLALVWAGMVDNSCTLKNFAVKLGRSLHAAAAEQNHSLLSRPKVSL